MSPLQHRYELRLGFLKQSGADLILISFYVISKDVAYRVEDKTANNKYLFTSALICDSI